VATGARKGVHVHTSGTTGTALHLILSRECRQREYAFQDLHRSWSGIERGDSVATIAGHPVVPTGVMHPPFWRRNAAANQTSSLRCISPDLRCLPTSRSCVVSAPRLIHGYPSALYLVPRSASSPVRKGFAHWPCTVTPRPCSTGSALPIERAFACKVFNEYGNIEMTANIVECERGQLHVKNEYSLIEFLRADGTRAAPGEYARIVTTGYWNDATPLVRYDTGDMAVPSGLSCECGRPGPLVEEILGRQDDIFVRPTGAWLGG